MSTEIIAVRGFGEFPLISALRDSAVAYACVKATHLVGVILIMGPVLAFDLRVLGVSRAIAVEHLARHLLPLAAVGVVFAVPTGLAMFAVHTDDLLLSRVFTLKMALLTLSASLAIIFHLGPYRNVAQWSVDHQAPVMARGIVLLSAACWFAVLVCATLLRN